MEMNFFMPARIVTGKGCIGKNSDIFSEYGRKCLIVTGRKSAEKCGALRDVINALEDMKISYKHYDKIDQNPSYASCRQAADEAISFGADFIVGIGGGSPLDASKAVAVLASDAGMDMESMYSGIWDTKPLPIIAVGTTAGTGSEVTSVSVITDTSGYKRSFRSKYTYPAVSFGDPSYTMTLSDDITCSTAVDALCHCVESYFNRTSNEICRSFALRGVKIFCEMLYKTSAGASKLTYEDREKLYCASIYGGLAISVAGTAFPHAMGYFLTERYGIPHGYACGVYFESFIEYNVQESPEEAESFFEQINISPKELCGIVLKNMPDRTCGISLAESEIKELVPRFENNKSLKKCYGNADKKFAEELLRRLFLKHLS